ncbi:DUF262 domain-containing protein [Bradyrhizobium diazoefficiens]|uniref:GmrSD restriction endonucleases N-terminal domain-containing protein n=1 Tax=Bradyrhizobium diazoefficiens TaxID=1355477 RepID=A0A809Y0U1_9BRAD|nr:hypothetical protein XF2B_53600 [Bradyrhizobium diazoefficiens]BCF18665.1 hypothetical protein XF13B_53560 [Bradyrhizobium diazoefficiens]
MSERDDDEDLLEVEAENDETPFVEFDISVSPSDPTLELLASQVMRGDVIIPFYQRLFVWKIEQASKLIESFLMGLPVPQVFLYVNDEGLLEVIDGQQRIKSVTYFFEGYFGEPDSQGRRQVFKLRGLSERSEYNDKTFAELSPRDQRKLKNSTLRAINIKQLKPSSRNDSVFHIFERLNTGGTQLKPQEIRNAVYRGKIVDELRSLSTNPGWQKALGISRPDKNQKDVELVLRLFALFNVWEGYEKPMLKYLNHQMDANKGFQSERALEFKRRFPKALKVVNDALERPFRPRGVINSAVLEAVMVTLLENQQITAAQLKRRYPALLADKQFSDTTRGGTTDTGILRNRLEIARTILTDAEG